MRERTPRRHSVGRLTASRRPPCRALATAGGPFPAATLVAGVCAPHAAATDYARRRTPHDEAAPMPRATLRWARCRLAGWQLEVGRHRVATSPQEIEHRRRC